MSNVVTQLTVKADGALAVIGQFERGMEKAGAATEKAGVATSRFEAAMAKAAAAQEKGLAITTQRVESISREQRAFEKLQGTVDRQIGLETKLRREAENAAVHASNAVILGYTSQEQALSTLISLERRHAAQLAAVKVETDDLTKAQHRLNAANDNGSAFRKRNLTYQLFDIGSSAAGGINPGMIAVQQGPQILQMYAGQGGVNQALKDTTSLLGGVAARFWPVAAAAAVASAAIVEMQSEIELATGKSVTFGQVLSGSLKVIAADVRTLLAPAIEAIAPSVQYAFDHLASAAIDLATWVTNAFRAAFSDLAFLWKQLPNIVGAAVTGGLNAMVSGITVLVKTAADYVDKLIATVNTALAAMNEITGTTIQIPKIDFQGGDFTVPNAYYEELRKANAEHREEVEKILGDDPIREYFKRVTKQIGDDLQFSLPDTMQAPALRGIDDMPAQIDLYKDLIKAGKQRIEDLQNEKELLGLSAGAAAELAFSQDAILKASEANVELSPEQLRAIRDQASAYGSLTQAIAETRVQNDLMFDRSQIGRTDIEQTVASQLRNLYGNDYANYIDGAIAGQIRFNDQLQQQHDRLDDISQTVRDELGDALASVFSGGIDSFDDFLDHVTKGFAQLAEKNISTLFEDLFKGKSGTKLDLGSLGNQIATAVSAAGSDPWSGLRITSGQRIPKVQIADANGSVVPFTASTTAQSGNSLLNLIGRAEGTDKGRGYNETLAFGRFTGGDRNLVGMTLDQIDALQSSMLRHTENTFNSSAVGRYQIVRTTLRGLKSELGLSGDQLFSPQLQDELAMQLARGRGANVAGLRNEWEGLRNVSGEEILKAFNGHEIAASVKTGAMEGTDMGLQNGIQAIVTGKAPNSAGAPQQGSAGAFMGLAGAGLGGFGLGYQSQSTGMGAIGGALQGFSAGAAVGMPIIGAFIGAVGGLIGGILGARKKQKEAQKQLDQQMGQIKSLLAVGEGTGVGTFQKQITDYVGEIDKAVDLAWKAGDQDLRHRLQDSVNTMFLRLNEDFQNGFEGVVEAYNSGLGSDSPFIQGQQAVADLREELKGFIADINYGYETLVKGARNNVGNPLMDVEIANLTERHTRQLEEANKAVVAMALSFLGGAEQLSEIEQQVMAIDGAASALEVTLKQLGLSADEAADAVDRGMVIALGKLKSQFLDAMNATIADRSGVGYLNDLMDAQRTYQDHLRDSAALGLDGSLALQELSLSLRAIVNDAGLTKDQIDILARSFPNLAAILGGITPGSSGSLADAQAAVDRAQSDLRAAYEKEAATLEETISKHERFIASIKAFKADLQLDSNLSPLSPYERLQKAQEEFQRTAALAMTGDEDAMGRLESVSRAYLEEAKAYYATSESYFRIFEEVQSVLDDALTSSEDQLSEAEASLATLKEQVGALIDIDDSVMTVADAIVALNAANSAENAALLAAIGAMQTAATDAITAAYQSSLGRAPDPLGLAYWQGQVNSGVSVGSVVSQIGSSPEAQSVAFARQIGQLYQTIFHRAGTQSEIDWWVSTGKALSQIQSDMIYAQAHGAMAMGGLVGNGRWNIDSVLAQYAGGGNIALAGGEFVTRAPSVNRSTLPVMDYINRTGSLPGNDNGSAALVAEVRALRAEVAALRAENAAGHQANVSATEGSTRAVENQTNAVRRADGRRTA